MSRDEMLSMPASRAMCLGIDMSCCGADSIPRLNFLDLRTWQGLVCSSKE